MSLNFFYIDFLSSGIIEGMGDYRFVEDRVVFLFSVDFLFSLIFFLDLLVEFIKVLFILFGFVGKLILGIFIYRCKFYDF